MRADRYIKLDCTQEEYDALTAKKKAYYGEGKKKPRQGWKYFFMDVLGINVKPVIKKTEIVKYKPQPIMALEGEKMTAQEILNE